jgi:hypothetical protein
MSAFVGFVVNDIRPDGVERPVVDWTHQPWDRGSNPKPDAIDTALVTLQVLPEIPDFDGNEAGAGYVNLFAKMIWSAAGTGRLTAEFDLVRGTSATVAANSIKLSVFYAVLSGKGNPPPLSLASGYKSLSVNASLGRGSRSSNDLLIRTFHLGPLAGGATSAPVKIPNFARALYLTSRDPLGGAFNAIVVQRSGSPTGPIVQADAVTGTQPVQFVPISHLASYVEVTPDTPEDLSVVFRIILP